MMNTAPLAEEEKAEQLRKLRRLNYLRRFSWECDRSGCDGKPHSGYPHKHARAAQIAPPGDWWGWFLRSGRGFGKTRCGAEYVKKRALKDPGHRTGIVCPDFAIGRDVCVEGESGLRGLQKDEGVIPWEKIAKWNRSIGELVLHNGSMFKIFGADTRQDAESIRGFQCHTLWFEELGVQRYGEVAWAMAEFACRLGDDPRVVITSTPRPIPLIRQLVEDPQIVVTTGSTTDNRDNLPQKYLDRVVGKYAGTTLGRQELDGELLDGSQGALWKPAMIVRRNEHPDLVRVVVAVDPAGTAHATSDLTGIVVVGLAADGTLWVLADRSGRYSPEQWRLVVCETYDAFHADLVVAEQNFGADLVAANLRAHRPAPPFKPVHASRGKAIRATPVVTLYEQTGKVFHVGTFADLEDEMTNWVPPGQFNAEGEPIPPSPDSPNRLDALVWGITELVIRPRKGRAYATMGA
jgi:phage terminase large subunit-like protein